MGGVATPAPAAESVQNRRNILKMMEKPEKCSEFYRCVKNEDFGRRQTSQSVGGVGFLRSAVLILFLFLFIYERLVECELRCPKRDSRFRFF